MRDTVKLVFSLGICYIAALIGSIGTASGVDSSWYYSLDRPWFNPPGWVFGPVWTILYTLMGISLYMVWKRYDGSRQVKSALAYFGVQLALNVLWSFSFFAIKSLPLSVLVIFLLLIFIALTLYSFYKVYRPAGYLLLPYLAWVSFAALINLSILCLNV